MRTTVEVPVGSVFGKLTTCSVPYRVDKLLYVDVLCVCGTTKSLYLYNLTKGKTKSCGCWKAEACRQNALGNTNRLSHNKSKSLIYKRWDAMVQRVSNPTNHNYSAYGGRGLTIEPKWLDFENFLIDMGEMPSEKHTLERLDTNAGYYADNCIWALREVQDDNKLQSIRYEYLGKMYSVNELAKISPIGLDRTTIYLRLHRQGYSVHQAIATPKGVKLKDKVSAEKLQLYPKE